METRVWRPKVQPRDHKDHKAELVVKWPEAEPKSWRKSATRVERRNCETPVEQVSDCDLKEPAEMETTGREGNRVGPEHRTGDFE